MKLFFTTLISIVSIIALAQTPQKISYQAVARQATGAVISNAPIGVKFIIYQGSVGGTISYEETHSANTNQFGLFTLFIGGGSPSIGTFNTINWAAGPYFVETLIDPTGGTSYLSIGTQQLMSVPYALFAERAGNASPTPTITINAPNSITNPAAGMYNIAVPSYSAGTGISISSGVITNTASSITPTIVAGTNMIVNPTVASNSYTISSPNYSLSTPSNTLLLLSNGINNSTAIIPAQLLSLSGSTLTSGVPTNSINLATLPNLWTASGSTLYPTSATRIGIGTTTPNSPFQVANYISFENTNGANTSLGFNTGTGISPNNFRNTFVGHAAGQAVGTGTASNNSYFGYNSGMLGNNVANNSFFGSGTGSNTTGSYNTFMGGYSGTSNTTGNNNLFLGYSSGFNNTSGNNNTFIGSGADLFSTTQHTNAAAIGYNAKVDADNAIVLGNSSTNVGIGIISPGVLPGANKYLTLNNGGAYNTSSISSLELIGNTNGGNSPSSRIDFINSFNTSHLARIEGITSAGSTAQGQLTFSTFSTTLNEAMRITQTGQVGIGCTNPNANYKLHVVGNVGVVGTIFASVASVSSGVLACSDIRYKKNVTPLNNALINILKLQGVSYDWKKEEFPDKHFTDNKQIGVIAQEIEKVYPELVATDANGYKAVDYSRLSPILLEGIKEQQKMILNQQMQINEMKKEMQFLLEKLNQLEKK
jgi:hypothetical protein